jgi:hypothetical protein
VTGKESKDFELWALCLSSSVTPTSFSKQANTYQDSSVIQETLGKLDWFLFSRKKGDMFHTQVIGCADSSCGHGSRVHELLMNPALGPVMFLWAPGTCPCNLTFSYMHLEAGIRVIVAEITQICLTFLCCVDCLTLKHLHPNYFKLLLTAKRVRGINCLQSHDLKSYQKRDLWKLY